MDPKQMKRHAMMLKMMEEKPFKKKGFNLDDEDESLEQGPDLAKEKAEMMVDPEGEMNEAPEDEMEEDGISSDPPTGRLFGHGHKKRPGVNIIISLGLGKKGLDHGG